MEDVVDVALEGDVVRHVVLDEDEVAAGEVGDVRGVARPEADAVEAVGDVQVGPVDSDAVRNIIKKPMLIMKRKVQ